MRALLLLVWAWLVILGGPGCRAVDQAADENLGFTAEPLTVASLALTPSSATLPLGNTQAFVVTANGTATRVRTGLTWSSSDAAVASVTAAGVVKALSVGTTTITVRHTASNVTASAVVTATAAALRSISLTPKNKKIGAGSTQSFTATGTFSDKSKSVLSGASLSWASSLPRVAAIDASGVATGVAAGTTTISVTHSSGITTSTPLTVNPATLTSIAVTPLNPTIPVGMPQRFTAMGTYSDGSVQDISASATWASSSPGVLAIAAGGAGTALALGTSTVSAALGGKRGTTRVVVTAVALASIAISPASVTLPAGTSAQLTALGTFNDLTTRDLTTVVSWTSSNASVLAVSGTGQVTALAAGAAIVTARDVGTGITASRSIAVNAAALTRIDVTPAVETKPAGVPVRFVASGTYTDGSHRDITTLVTWSATGSAANVSNAPASEGEVVGLVPGFVSVRADDPATGLTSSATLTVTPAVLAEIQITPPAPSIALGRTQLLAATGIYTDMTRTDLTSDVTWSSSDDAIASVSNAPGGRGLVTSVAVGTAVITARDPATGTSAARSFTVTSAVVTDLSLGLTGSTSIPLGDWRSATVTGIYSDLTTADLTSSVTWSSSDPSIVAVSPAAGPPAAGERLTALAVGSATITATDPTTGLSASIALTTTSAELRRITLSPDNTRIPRGLSVELQANGVYSDGSTADLTPRVTWSTTTPTLIAVSNAVGSAGHTTGLAVGSGTVMATDPLTGITVTGAAEVVPSTLAYITIAPMNPRVAKGASLVLNAVGTFTDGTTQDLTNDLTWITSDPTIASISNAAGTVGSLSGLVVGSTVVVATHPSTGIAASTVATVTISELVSVSVTPNPAVVSVGSSAQLAAIGTYSDGSTADVTTTVVWSSADVTLATVSGAGLVTIPVTNGERNTTVSIAHLATGLSASASVVASAATPSAIEAWPSQSTLTVGQTAFFSVILTMTDRTTRDVTGGTLCTATGPLTASTSRAAVYGAGLGTGTVTCTNPSYPGLVIPSVDITVVQAPFGGADVERDFSGAVNPAVQWRYGGVSPPSPTFELGAPFRGSFGPTATDGWLFSDGAGATASVAQVPATPTPCAPGWVWSGATCTLRLPPSAPSVIPVMDVGNGLCSGTRSIWVPSYTPPGLGGLPQPGYWETANCNPNEQFRVPQNVAGARSAVVSIVAQYQTGGIWDDGAHAFDVRCGQLRMTVNRNEVTGNGYPHSKSRLWSVPVGTACAIENFGDSWTPPLQNRGYVGVSFAVQSFSAALPPPPSSVVLESSGAQAITKWTAPASAVYAVDATFSETESFDYECGRYVYDCTPRCHGCFIGQCWCGDNYPDFCGYRYEPATCHFQTGSSVAIASSSRGPLFSSTVNLGGVPTTRFTEALEVRAGEDVEFGVTSSPAASSTTVTRTSPTRLQATLTPISISASGATTCTVRPDGSLWCWGYNYFGNVGDGTVTNRLTPTRVGTSNDWSLVSAGLYSTCAIRRDGSLWCWGQNANNPSPIQVGGPARTWIDVVVGAGLTCARSADSSVYCWGVSVAPAPTFIDTGFTAVTAGGLHACGLRTDRSLWCWGANARGQLGLGSTTDEPAPRPVSPGTSWLRVSAGSESTCAVDTSSQVHCWGANNHGKLGDGTTDDRSVPTPTGVTARLVSAGAHSTCALDIGGRLTCWGAPVGGVGADQLAPTPPAWTLTTPIVSVVQGSTNAGCVLDAGSRVWCWGENMLGELGDGTTSRRTVPVQIF